MIGAPNLTLLRETMERIEAHPEAWNQWKWGIKRECGTTLCFAGTAVTLAGYNLVWTYDGHPIDSTSRCVDPDGNTSFIRTTAADLLGLTDLQADRIFYCLADTPAELRNIVERTVGEKL